MDGNGNQRKRAGRLTKNTNNNESMSPPQNSECNEVMEVSAVAISPTLEETESSTNAPVAECRRSSRKKIIKFDVRDLLNKNRKTHKIQIEARIDSNAPTASKASTAGGAESANSKTSSTVSEDLLSKQKTFLEKSAIFRRYSISQEHKPPPLPLPIPPLLGKTSDNNEAGLSGTSTNRRLSRTQEFFSNVMIKPKQTTSLIVAQIESNTPSSVSAKRKNLNKSVELETKAATSTDIESSPVLQQKRRGRPAKFKTPSSVDSNASFFIQEEVKKRQITPEKAKNWKEYKACLAQQSSSTNIETETKKSQNKEQDDQLNVSKSKPDLSTDMVVNFEETSQSDISKSDDDGNFSGFQTSKDDISCDSLVLENICLEKEKEAISENISKEIKITENEAKTSLDSEEKEIPEKTLQTKESDSVPNVKPKTSSKKIQVTAKQKQTEEIPVIKPTSEMNLQQTVTDLLKKVEKNTATKSDEKEIQNKSTELERTISLKKSGEVRKEETIIKQSTEFLQKQETENKTNQTNTTKEEIEKCNLPKEDAIQTESKNYKSDQPTTTAVKESETPEIMVSKQAIRIKRRPVRKEDNKDLSQDNQTKTPSSQIENKNDKILLELNKRIEEDKQEKLTTSTEIPSETQTFETQTEFTRKLKTPDIIKATKIIDECTPDTKLTTSDILLITSQLPESQPTTPSEETMKSFSRTSSSSESENASSYSSEPASTSSSSSSSRSYKSGDKLRVSLKRISLPKSPSTSSQTSTSEELNSSKNPGVLKKKPPMAKRSKRLQRKFVEMLGNKDESENIDDCFKRITNEETNSAERDSIEGGNFFLEDTTIKESLKIEASPENSKDCKKIIDSAEKVKKVVTEFSKKEISAETLKGGIAKVIPSETVVESLVKETITQDLKQKAIKSLITCEDLDSLSNDSLTTTPQLAKGTILKDTFSIGKRKSLRNRKDNSNDDKDQIKVKEEEKLTEKDTEVQDLKQKDTNSNKIEEITQEKLEEIPIDLEMQPTGESDQSEETEDNQKIKTRNSQPTKQQPQRKLKSQSSWVEDQKSNNEVKIKITEETLITDKVVEDEQEKDLEKSSPKNESITESIADIIEYSLKNSDHQEKYSKTTSTRSKTNKEKSSFLSENLAESDVIEDAKTTKSEKKSDAMKIEATEDKPTRTKSPITDKLDKATKTALTINKTNKENYSAKESNIQAEISSDTKLKETIFKDGRTSEVAKVEASQSSTDKTKSKEISTTTAKEVDDVKSENTRKDTVTRSKTNIEEISTKETKNQIKENKNDKPTKCSVQDKDDTKIKLKPKLLKDEVSEDSTNKSSTGEETTKIPQEQVSLIITSTGNKTKDTKISDEYADKTIAANLIDKEKESSTKQIKEIASSEYINEIIKSPLPINIDTSDDKKEKPDKIATTRGKTTKEEADNITPIRSRSKKTVETPEDPKSTHSEKIVTIEKETDNITPTRSKSKKIVETPEAPKSQTSSSEKPSIIQTEVDIITPSRSRSKKTVETIEAPKSQTTSSEKPVTIDTEVDNIIPIRSRSKKTVETTEAPSYTKTETKESAPKPSTILKTHKHAEPSKTLGIEAREIITTECAQSVPYSKISKPSSPKRLTRQVSSNKTDMPIEVSKTSLETLEAVETPGTITTEPCHSISITKVSLDKDRSFSAKKSTIEVSSPKPKTVEVSSTKSISDITVKSFETSLETNSLAETQEITTKVFLNKDPSSSPKRKSLRNQKDDDSIEESSTQIQHSDATADIPKMLEETSVTSTKLEQPQDEETVKVPKRRGRKPRFKNLHTPENESETDSSNGKNTPINEIIQQKLKDQTIIVPKEKLEDKEKTKIVQTQQEIMKADKDTSEANSENAKMAEETANLKENSKANLSSSQIQNVSIETNTLLDILRTVQSNTEAALKANKSLIDIQKTDNENTNESLLKTDKAESAKKSSQDLLGTPQESNLTSPTRSNTNSPLSLKRMPISPAHSESASPLTLKKVTQSPTRSDSSSPLTLKKVTRRYERRSRREDAAHKTLEETFAEIAAESSKAVLAAKEFDINVGEQQTGDENPQQEIKYINTEKSTEREQITENLNEIDKLALVTKEVTLKTDEQVVTKETILGNVSQPLENLGKTLNDFKPTETEVTEKIVETQETTKLTPSRRGRKPKIRSMEIQDTKEELEEKSSIKSNIEITTSKEVVEEEQIVIETQEETKIDNKSNKTKKTKETTQTEIPTECDSKNLVIPPPQTKIETKETSNLSEATTESSLKHLEDKNDCKLNKKPFKKRDTFKSEAVPEDSTNIDVILTKEKEDEVRTPKQSAKKRDTSQTKSETKSSGKKLTKKTKNDEDDNSNLQKDDTLTKSATSHTTTTTPPPSKRGRKPKNQQETPQPTTSSKKKNKKDLPTDNIEGNIMQEKIINTPESESESTSLDKSLDEKLAKKKRQKKLKEAFEAALTEDIEKSKEAAKSESSTNFGLARLNKSPTPPSTSNDITNESSKITCFTPVEAEEDPDPLKDIEKFIADGVNLLKKDYKLDEDSVDDVIAPTPAKITEILEEPVKSSTEESGNPVYNTFETPADTPINTPSVTPPPKSPTSIESSTPDENSGVRRSHRIKLITKTPKALVGRGLVRDKERFSIKDDVETKSHYTLDDHLTDLAEVEAKNAKFLKEMEERLSNFHVIKENEYLCERVISREARKMICDCFLTQEEEERGELGCGEDCLNRLLMIECGPECNVKERCTNKRFQKLLCSPCRVFRTEKKGFGIMADIEILPGEFIMEYVGEVIDTDEFEKRRIIYSQDKNRHYYFMALRSDAIIDATIKGNISRFINHSCDPNAETQKWTVNGELRIGFFSRKSIMPGEEITFNYQYQRYGREAQRCYCESANCRGWIGQEPTSDEGEQIDDDDEDDESEDDEEEEEADTSNLLVQDDDEDSDTSVADPEEVQKQLEMAAAQAEVELAPLQLLEAKDKQQKSSPDEEKSSLDIIKTESDEDSKSKFKKLLSKMAEKVAAKQKQTKREQKMQRKKKSKESSGDLGNKLRFLEDPDIEDEVEFLKECGLKNQSDTLRLSRLMVRAKLVQTRLNLLEILRKGDLPCRRLFLDYHGLRLLHGWMSEDAGNMQIRLALLQTLETLPIANKTVLTDSKVMQVVRNWCGNNTNLSPNEDSSSSNSNSQDIPAATTTNFEEGSELAELQKLGLKLISTWEGLPEIFRIPKKERIEQMKEHEREADRQYAANAEIQQNNLTTDRYRRDRFGRGFNTSTPNTSNRFTKPNNGNPHRAANTTQENIKNLSKAQRREMFAAKVARDEAEKRLAEERREFETKCRFFGLDPKKTRPQDIPFCVNPATGQWFSIERKPITTPPSYAHVQVPIKPKTTDPNDYQLPAVCSTLPLQWKYAITPQGKIYYYHIKHRIPQWEPPSAAQLQECEMEAREEDSESELTTTAGEDSSDDDDDVLVGMDAAQLKAYIDRKVEMRRQKRYQRLVDERSISPRREEDRIYNQIEVRKYKENKEKIRKRKEEIRRRRAEALRQTSLNMCTLGSITETNLSNNKLPTESNEELGALPIQDYLLSSDEEVDLKAEVNSPLMDKIVEGDKIVDELDALTTKRQLKRPLPPHRDLSEASTSSASSSGLSTTIARQEYKKRKLEKKEKRKPKEQQDAKYRKNKEKFRCEIAGIIVHHLKPYLKDNCTVGRIQSNEDFNHLARKLTHFVMIKELKYCESVGQTLVVTESVKSKSREFIKKYMAKYGEVYIKPTNDPDFKDIPFTL